MLKKPFRLSSKYEFNITKKYGKPAQGKYFHLYCLKPRNYEGPTKIGIIISRKFSKSAAKRNRVKRVFREAIRMNLDKIAPGYWIVILPKFISINKKYEEISTDVTETIQKISFSG